MRHVGHDDAVFQIGEQYLGCAQARCNQLLQFRHQNVDHCHAHKLAVHADGMGRGDGVVGVANVIDIRAVDVSGVVLVGFVKPLKSAEIQSLLRALVLLKQRLLDGIVVFEPPFKHPIVVVFAFHVDVAGKTRACAIGILAQGGLYVVLKNVANVWG